MRLKYNILCIDNEIDSLGSMKSHIHAVNDNVGVETFFIDLPVVAGARESQKDFKERIEKELNEKYASAGSFDLILIDLHMQDEGDSLPDPLNGADFVGMVRDHTMYKPIVFYSGGNPPADDTARNQLHEAIEAAGIWGKNLMVCPRNDLPSFIEKLMIEMHQEEHKINNVRGLLMDQISEIDALYIEAIKKLWPLIPAEKEEVVLRKVKERAKNSVKRSIKACKSVRDIAFDELPEKFICDYKICDLNSRAMILKTVLEQFNNRATFSNVLLDFYDTNKTTPDIALMHIRNNYAHNLANNLTHNSNRCKYIRQETRKHLKNAVGLLASESE